MFFLKKINSQGNCSKGFVAEPGCSQGKTVSLIVREGDVFSPTVLDYLLHLPTLKLHYFSKFHNGESY